MLFPVLLRSKEDKRGFNSGAVSFLADICIDISRDVNNIKNGGCCL